MGRVLATANAVCFNSDAKVSGPPWTLHIKNTAHSIKSVRCDVHRRQPSLVLTSVTRRRHPPTKHHRANGTQMARKGHFGLRMAEKSIVEVRSSQAPVSEQG